MDTNTHVKDLCLSCAFLQKQSSSSSEEESEESADETPKAGKMGKKAGSAGKTKVQCCGRESGGTVRVPVSITKLIMSLCNVNLKLFIHLL